MTYSQDVRGVLAEVVKKAGGVAALAAKLRITPQAIHKWHVNGISEDRIDEVARLTGVSRKRLRAYSEEKLRAKRRGLEWWEPTTSESQSEPRPDFYAAERERLLNRYYDGKRDPPPAKPTPPIGFAVFSLLNAAGHLRWPRSFEQHFRAVKWIVGRVYAAVRSGSGSK